MTERKLTDEEIIKTLERCADFVSGGEPTCNNCPLYDCDDCSVEKLKQALDLINRQKAEIEEKSNKLREILPIVAELKTEALTEYVTELEKRLISGGLGIAFVRAQMHKLLKEMTGGGYGQNQL